MGRHKIERTPEELEAIRRKNIDRVTAYRARMKSNTEYMEKVRRQARESYYRRRDKVKAAKRKWYMENLDKVRQYYQDNKERLKAYSNARYRKMILAKYNTQNDEEKKD